ncbi:MAG: hypothetical protein ACYSWQ_02930 [Planctomycetota bacterium]|jgi:hypothetical protein
MATEMLQEVINDGEKISLMDGSVWWINPTDMSTVCTWLPTAEIEISSSDDPVFDHILTNGGVSAGARRFLPE